jgi:hypothetical protein
MARGVQPDLIQRADPHFGLARIGLVNAAAAYRHKLTFVVKGALCQLSK